MVNTNHLVASELNNRFETDLFPENEDDNIGDPYCNENSRDRYFDVADTEALFNEDHLQDFFCMNINIRGLNVIKNYIQLVALVESLPKKPHVIAVNEIFARENEEGAFTNLDGYRYLPNCRKEYAQGGVALYIKDDLKFSQRHDLTILEEKYFESIFVDLHVKPHPITIGTVYRSPDESISSNNKFLHHLRNSLRILDRKKNPCFIMGDMNYDLLDLDSQAEDLFKDEMFSFYFYPLINHPTRIADTSATCIDHIWTNVRDRPITSGIFTDKIADHLATFQLSDLGDILKNDKTNNFLSSADLKKITAILSQININDVISNSSIDEAVEIITAYIFQAIKSVEKPRKPTKKRDKWYDKSLHKLKLRASKLYKKYISDRTYQNKHEYNRAKNIYFYELKSKRDSHFKALFDKFKNNMKSTWRTINKLMGRVNKTSTISSSLVPK